MIAPLAASLIDARVVARRHETPDVVAFRLAGTGMEDGRGLPPFDAGAHIDIHLPGGLVRQYSLSNDPAERDTYEIAVKLEPASRGGSRWLHDAVQVGDRLRIGTPKNLFPLAGGATRSILIAAGIGITPILSMARRLAREGGDFELHYFARSIEAVAFRNVLETEIPAATLHIGLDAEATGTMVGRILPAGGGREHVYFCGPSQFMAAVREIAAGRVPEECLHWEHFSAPAASSAETGDAAFSVILARSSRTLLVPAGQSITDVLFENAIPIETSCEAGICGVCRTRVLDGVPLHRDALLSAAERTRNDCLLPCVSRCAGGTLTLDL